MSLQQMDLGAANASAHSGTEEFISMLLDGSILAKLDNDFLLMRVQDYDEYMAYINEYWHKYPNNSFALYKGCRLDITCIGVLAAESIANAMYPHLRLNDAVGFRLVNTKRGEAYKVTTYEELKQKLEEEK